MVARKDCDKWKYLVLRYYRNWDFPKGLLEVGEYTLQAATRETMEETGIADLNFRWGMGNRGLRNGKMAKS